MRVTTTLLSSVCKPSYLTLLGGLAHSHNGYHSLLSLSLSHHFKLSHFISLISAFSILTLSLIDSFFLFILLVEGNCKTSHIYIYIYVCIAISIYLSSLFIKILYNFTFLIINIETSHRTTIQRTIL